MPCGLFVCVTCSCFSLFIYKKYTTLFNTRTSTSKLGYEYTLILPIGGRWRALKKWARRPLGRTEAASQSSFHTWRLLSLALAFTRCSLWGRPLTSVSVSVRRIRIVTLIRTRLILYYFRAFPFLFSFSSPIY